MERGNNLGKTTQPHSFVFLQLLILNGLQWHKRHPGAATGNHISVSFVPEWSWMSNLVNGFVLFSHNSERRKYHVHRSGSWPTYSEILYSSCIVRQAMSQRYVEQNTSVLKEITWVCLRHVSFRFRCCTVVNFLLYWYIYDNMGTFRNSFMRIWAYITLMVGKLVAYIPIVNMLQNVNVSCLIYFAPI